MMIKPEKKVVIEQNKRFSESFLWQLQREYFDQEGINAWVSQVPFYVTSNPYIANCYAITVIHFIRDWVKEHPEAKKHPFYVLELGTGSGQFSFYVMKKLHELRHEFKMEDIKIHYIMSDFTPNNIKYWQDHPALKPFLEAGLLDFAIYNLENDDPITLETAKVALTPDHFVNPLSVCANYIFDTVTHDIFNVSHGRIQEVLLSLSTDHDNMKNERPMDWEKVTIDYSPIDMRKDYYPEDTLNQILNEYQHEFKDTNFLFPIGALRTIKKLKQLTNDKIFLIASDKGYSTMESLDHLGHPTLAFHGSFSMMVNFDAIARYFKHTGGDYFLQTNRKGIKTSVFCSGMKLNEMPETSNAITQWIEGVSPADYFILHRRISDSYQECGADTLASHLAFTGWDPYIFHKLSSRICAVLDETDTATIEYLASNMPKIFANFYYMPKSDNTPFEIAVFYHMIKRYDDALKYYQLSEPYCTDGKFGLFYNMALCQYHAGLHQDALQTFKNALLIDPDSKETSEWVTFLEPLIGGDKTDEPSSATSGT